MFSDFDIHSSELIREISPNENMFGPLERIEHYFRVGQSALNCIGMSLQMAQRSVADVKHILDLPCGHGRVLRYLKAAFPQAEITACDILQDGVDFCRSTFDAVGVYSSTDPTKIPLESDHYDLIWVGSLFTHLDRELWHSFLDMFRRCLRRDGLLVFTAHGSVDYVKIVDGKAEMRDWQRNLLRHQFERSGFAYYDYDGTPGYGSSLSSPAWVTAQVAQFSELRLVLCSERACAWHQDVYAYVRDPDWQMQRPRVTVPDIASTRLQMALNGGKRRTKDLLRPGYHALKRLFRRK